HAKKVVFLDVDHAEIARQDFDVTKPEAVVPALGRKHEIIRQRRDLAQDLVALVAEQIGFIKARQRRGQKISAAGSQRLGRNVRRGQHEALEFEDLADRVRRRFRPFAGRGPQTIGVQRFDRRSENVRQRSDGVGDDETTHAVADEGKLNPWPCGGRAAIVMLAYNFSVDGSNDLDKIWYSVVRSAVIVAEIDDGSQQRSH